MIPNPRKRAAVLLPLLVALLAPPALLAQDAPPEPPKTPASSFRLGGVEPLVDDQMKVVDLLAAKQWKDARDLAKRQFLVLSGYSKSYPGSVASGLVLEALADAGLGDEGPALCLWYAAQHLDPNLTQADFSRFGDAGVLLTRHRDTALLVSAAADPGALKMAAPRQGPKERKVHQKPEIIHQTRPLYPELARRARVEGKVVIETIIEKDGSVSHPGILQSQPMGLDVAAVEAVCDWKFKPATLKGEPVRVYYVLTVNFAVQKTPGPPWGPP
ncbi:MAG TPA: energy transducer TonB [Thermoanaerobaculia bacterium]|jgi:protein TonB|nr:energy transducer TonB [Thermoanaerobaculia bacterium]